MAVMSDKRPQDKLHDPTSNRMDASEALVARYLRSLGFLDVVYEPDGNVPPDFLVEGRIAVEVRRLNQNVLREDGRPEGLEEVFIPFWQKMKTYLPTVASSFDGESWYVSVDIRRPLESWKYLEPRLRRALLEFMTSPRREDGKVEVSEHLRIDFSRAGRTYDGFFVLGAGADRESGGWILSEIHRNLQLCSTEKEHKVSRYRAKYLEWWLVLPDHIGYALNSNDRRHFHSLPSITQTWSRLVLINPHNPNHAFEV